MTVEEMAKAYNVLLAAVVGDLDVLEDPGYTYECAVDEACQLLGAGLSTVSIILREDE